MAEAYRFEGDVWHRIPDRVRAAMLARGEDEWQSIYAGVATHNKVWRPLRPPVLTFAAYRTLTELSARLAHLVLESCRRRAATAGELRRVMNVPVGRIEMLDEQLPLSEDLLVAVRPDILLSDGVPRFVECNIDSALGGAFDSDGIAARFLAAYAGHGILDAMRIETPRSAVDERFAAMRTALHLADGTRVALLFHSGGTYPDTDQPEKLIRLLAPVCEQGRRMGLDVVVYPLEWLTVDERQRLCAGDKVVDAVLRLYLPEDVPAGPGHEALQTAARQGTVQIFTESAAWLLANKITFAWLWADLGQLSAADQDLVRRYVPKTELMTPDAVERAVAGQRDLVLKPTDAFGGSGVLVGRETAPEVWRAAVERAAQRGDSILQEYIPVDLLAMDFVEMETGKTRHAEVPFCVAPYLFGGRAAGAYLRFGVPDAGLVVNLGQGALTSGLLLVELPD